LVQYDAIPVYFRHPAGSVRLEIHMDDGHGAGTETEIRSFLKTLGSNVLLKSTGPHSTGSTYSHLKRERIMRKSCTIIRPAQRYTLAILALLGMENCKPVATPMVDSTAISAEDLELLGGDDARTYRSGTGIALYLSMDRPDTIYCVKELGRFLSAPCVIAMAWLRRLARYLKGTLDYVVVLQRPQQRSKEALCCTDSNWAGCKRTRKSTSCFCSWLGGMSMEVACRTQTAIALSSAEAEYYAGVSGAAELLYLCGLAKFFGWHVDPVLKMDSSGARGIAGRQGVGKVRSLETRVLWLQQKVRERAITIGAVPGAQNPADIGTKCLDVRKLRTFAADCGIMRLSEDGTLHPLDG